MPATQQCKLVSGVPIVKLHPFQLRLPLRQSTTASAAQALQIPASPTPTSTTRVLSPALAVVVRREAVQREVDPVAVVVEEAVPSPTVLRQLPQAALDPVAVVAVVLVSSVATARSPATTQARAPKLESTNARATIATSRVTSPRSVPNLPSTGEAEAIAVVLTSSVATARIPATTRTHARSLALITALASTVSRRGTSLAGAPTKRCVVGAMKPGT